MVQKFRLNAMFVGVIICSLFNLNFAVAQFVVPDIELDKIYRGQTLETVTGDQLVDEIKNRQVVFVSEFHGALPHHEVQKSIIKGLIDRGRRVFVAIEHISYLEQNALDAYLNGKLSEDNLKKAAKIKDLASWKEQLLLPIYFGGWSFGINAPRWLTGKINAVGYDLLSSEEKMLLPQDFTLGNDLYKKRILDALGGGHGGFDFEKFFQAQSAWDDTSALQIINILKKDPSAVVVVMFGDFHISYGGGLPDRLRARGVSNMVSISQYCGETYTKDELLFLTQPHPLYGARGDYVVPSRCQ